MVHQEILLPKGAAKWLGNRETLWNHVEKMEKRRDAQLAREINVSLPHELTAEERLALIRGFVMEEFVARGMVADLTLHDPVPGESDARHFHAHVLLTLREAHGNGLSRVKTRGWNSDALLLRWRQQWEIHANRALELAGHAARIDHRSLLDQRDDALQRGTRMRRGRWTGCRKSPSARRPWHGIAGVCRTAQAAVAAETGWKEPPKRRSAQSRIEQNRRILRTNARKAQAYSAFYRYRLARIEQRKAAVGTYGDTEDVRRGPGKGRKSSILANGRLTACPFAHCLHRLGLMSIAQLIATRLAAWATLEEAQRLEVERRFAERVKQCREQQRRLPGVARGRPRRASGPTAP